jgi:release factor family 3
MATRANTRDAAPVRSFRAEDLQQLLADTGGPCVSIHLATHRRYPDWTQDPTHFKNLLGQAEAQLAASPGARDAAAMLEPARRLLDDPGVWEHALDGLAVYVSPSYAAAFRVPTPLPDAVVIADTFHTKPLFRFLGTNSRYYVLAISQNAVTLYHGSSFGAEPVDLQSLPSDVTAALGLSELDEHERGVFVHGGTAGGRAFHGRGPGKEERKETLLKFFRAIDKGLHEYLRAERAPLLIAGVKYYRPIYREASTYPHLLAQGLDGNFERANGDVIHAAAWPIVSQDRERRIAEWSDRFRSLAPKGLAVDGAEAVASAVVQGRVRAILAAENGNTWGRLDRATGEVKLLSGPNGTASPDLLDDICEEGWKRGAEIYVLPQPSLPTARPIAAVLRF